MQPELLGTNRERVVSERKRRIDGNGQMIHINCVIWQFLFHPGDPFRIDLSRDFPSGAPEGLPEIHR